MRTRWLSFFFICYKFFFLPLEQLEFVLLNFIGRFFRAFFVITSFCWWWWSTIIRFKSPFWGSSTGNAVLAALTSFIFPDRLRFNNHTIKISRTRAGFLLNIFKRSLLPHWFFSHYSRYQPPEALSFSLPFSFSPLRISFLSSTPLWLGSSVPFHPLHTLSLLPLIPLDRPDE